MKIVALTGAGISKSAGIPTFEEIEGLKDKLTVEFRDTHPGEFWDAKEKMIDNMKDKLPTKAHLLLAKYDIPIITMNIDCLHSKAGSKIVYELHGNYRKDNIVLYGENIYFAEEAMNLLYIASKEAQKTGEDSVLLVIGTSMQTAFAYMLVKLASKLNMQVIYMNNNADEELENFFNKFP